MLWQKLQGNVCSITYNLLSSKTDFQTAFDLYYFTLVFLSLSGPVSTIIVILWCSLAYSNKGCAES